MFLPAVIKNTFLDTDTPIGYNRLTPACLEIPAAEAFGQKKCRCERTDDQILLPETGVHHLGILMKFSVTP
jgi:hypothetical protein